MHLAQAGKPGGKGVTVAVLDTGVAYADRGRFRKSPDLNQKRFVRGWDFVNDDPYPNDDFGHGTHVASTIAEGTGNAIGLTGLAYGVKIMPVKVLDRAGEGDSQQIADGIRFAADHGAQVINLSFEFPSDITRAQIPNILDAIRHARRKSVLVVGASGNAAAAAVAYPARSSDVLSVGATTQHGCQADYSNEGTDLDLVAPGGGADAGARRRPGLPPRRTRRPRHLPDDLHLAPRAASACRTATSAPRWPRPTCRPPPRSSSRRASSARTQPRPRSSAGWRPRRRDLGPSAQTRTTAGAASTPPARRTRRSRSPSHARKRRAGSASCG